MISASSILIHDNYIMSQAVNRTEGHLLVSCLTLPASSTDSLKKKKCWTRAHKLYQNYCPLLLQLWRTWWSTKTQPTDTRQQNICLNQSLLIFANFIWSQSKNFHIVSALEWTVKLSECFFRCSWWFPSDKLWMEELEIYTYITSECINIYYNNYFKNNFFLDKGLSEV